MPAPERLTPPAAAPVTETDATPPAEAPPPLLQFAEAPQISPDELARDIADILSAQETLAAEAAPPIETRGGFWQRLARRFR
jgi:hypothetical protein